MLKTFGVDTEVKYITVTKENLTITAGYNSTAQRELEVSDQVCWTNEITFLQGINQGSGPGQRNGDSINVRAINIKLVLVSDVIDFLSVRIIVFTSSRGKGSVFDKFFSENVKWRAHPTARINRDYVHQVLYDKVHYFPGSTQYTATSTPFAVGSGNNFTVAPAIATTTYGDMSKRISINLKGVRREVIFNTAENSLKNERDMYQIAIIGTDGNNTGFTTIGKFFISTRVYFTG
jgi:hypothetical protein